MEDVERLMTWRGRPLLVMLGVFWLAFAVAAWHWINDVPDPFDYDAGPSPWSVVMFVAGTVTVVVWVVWFQGLYDRVVDARRSRFPRSAGMWGWLLPGANLVIPKMLVNDVWRAGDVPGEPPSSPPWPVQAWWVLWVLFALAGRAARAIDGSGSTTGHVTVLALFLLAETVLAAMTVRILTRRIGEVVPALPPQPVPVGA